MALIVAKFGGTSVASPERIKNVAKRLVGMRQRGDEVVAVVSAMGKTTDELMGLASAITTAPPARELDRLLSTGEQVSMTLLAMAIEALGYKSISFTGRQAGIETNGTHNKARIVKVHNERILDALDDGAIPVVAGFQGIDANGDITTLGRGGSDTTAVAIAWGINADVCEIYSDVDGVYTTDPRIAPPGPQARFHLLRRHAGALQRRLGCAAEPRGGVRPQMESGHPFSLRILGGRGNLCQGGVRNGRSRHYRHRQRHVGSEGDHPPGARCAERGRSRVRGAGRCQREPGHDHPECVRGRLHRHLLHDSRGRSAPRQGDHGASSVPEHRRSRVHRRRGHREGVAGGHGHEVVAGRRLAHVPDFGRQSTSTSWPSPPRLSACP